MAFGDYQIEIYLQGLAGVRAVAADAFRGAGGQGRSGVPPSVWSYVAGGAGDERTQRVNRDGLRALGPDAADVRRRRTNATCPSTCSA